MQEPTAAPKRTSPWAWLLCFVTLTVLAIPVAQRLNEPWSTSGHSHLTAWFAMMSETTVEAGFFETRFMPVVSPNPAEFPNFRYYFSHPVLDVMLRAVLMKFFGTEEWVTRLQGFVGWVIAGFFLFLISRRHFGIAGSIAALAAFMGMGMGPEIAMMSLHHPMVMASSMAGLWFFSRYRQKPAAGRQRPTRSYVGMMVCFALSMQFDWPGYFAPALVWLSTLAWAGSARFDKKLTFGLAILASSSVLFHWIHVDVIAGEPGDLLRALRFASNTGIGSVYSSAGFPSFFRNLVGGYGVIGLAVALTSLIQVCFVPQAKHWRKPLLFCFAWGALNIVAFPHKAPNHTFWSCYWLPWVAVSYGICAEVLTQILDRKLGRKTGSWLAVLAIAGFGYAAWTRPIDTKGITFGTNHRTAAEQLKSAVPKKDRWVFVTNYDSFDGMIMSAYLRTNLLICPDVSANDLEPAVKQQLRANYWHVKNRRVLFYIAEPQDDSSDAILKDRRLRAELRRIGEPYRGLPNLIDISEWVWEIE
ncbi:MAG: hypothetical protein V3W41_16920 [Planctomycetota bacterium]